MQDGPDTECGCEIPTHTTPCEDDARGLDPEPSFHQPFVEFEAFVESFRIGCVEWWGVRDRGMTEEGKKERKHKKKKQRSDEIINQPINKQ